MTDLARPFHNALQASFKLACGLALLGCLIYAMSGIYSVEPGEIAVHSRLGEILERKVLPGIHFGLPIPFDRIEKVPVKRMKSLRVMDFAGQAENQGKPLDFTVRTGIPAYCITGDNNIVTISCVGQYTVDDAAEYLFQCRDPETILLEVTKNGLAHCLARMPVDVILTTGKNDIATFVKSWVNRKLAQQRCGLTVLFLELKSVSPPALVQDDFQDVIKAGIDRKKMINDAESYENQRMSATKAQAEKTLQEAMAYKSRKTSQAKGESERFLKKLSEFHRNPLLVWQKELFDFFQVLGNKRPRSIILDTESGQPPVKLRFSVPPLGELPP